MSSFLKGCSLLQAQPLKGCIRVLSTGRPFAERHNNSVKDYRRRWLTNENWPTNRYTGKPWASIVPMEQNIDLWSKKYAYFGAYDFMDILGDDLTLDPNVLCGGPSYMRGQKLNELQRLVKRREMHGDRMHAESLHQMEKRIRFLIKRENRVRNKRTRHRKIDENVVPLVKERFE